MCPNLNHKLNKNRANTYIFNRSAVTKAQTNANEINTKQPKFHICCLIDVPFDNKNQFAWIDSTEPCFCSFSKPIYLKKISALSN